MMTAKWSMRGEKPNVRQRLCGEQEKNKNQEWVEFPELAAADSAAEVIAAASSLLTKSFNSLLGLKKGIRFAGTSTFSPVFGLRPTRPRRCRVRKLPKPRISIFSPFCMASMMLSKIVSTIVSDSLRGSSVTFNTSSIKSAFVSVGCFVIGLCLFNRKPLLPHNSLGRGDLEEHPLPGMSLFLSLK